MAPNSIFTDREQEHLAELTEMDMALARHVHAHALASDDPAVIAEMGRTYQRASRSARQSIALSAKLRRDAARDVAEAARLAERAALLTPWTHRPDTDVDDDSAWDEEDGDEDDASEIAPTVEPPAPLTPPDPAALQREADLRSALRRLIWDERERLETEETPDDLFALLEERLESRRRCPTSCDKPLETQVIELCVALGLPTEPAATWRDLPDPPDREAVEAPQPQSSA
ncbi:MAG: hypothetical protein KKE02_07435 [Alphaproteobacteria bacterium]|nr:hypothetical protein [Alphaproteobacteria bacterium]MBU1512587.1 hypothetical protein [Alphaproteobacteria bacterium]MBU2092926.1 hypothetical protein [Alphaproteobacteria bacterium]MBU2150835.1 hypothetical protein [Alphaproteobacteria bacterium]MBU2307953.1 hypothetical protein [Alphaproteobacteria bacterium]